MTDPYDELAIAKVPQAIRDYQKNTMGIKSLHTLWRGTLCNIDPGHLMALAKKKIIQTEVEK